MSDDPIRCDSCGAQLGTYSRGQQTGMFGFAVEIRGNGGRSEAQWWACNDECAIRAIRLLLDASPWFTD
jgi:hypothetical protein